MAEEAENVAKAQEPTGFQVEAANTLAGLGNLISPETRAELEKAAGGAKAEAFGEGGEAGQGTQGDPFAGENGNIIGDEGEKKEPAAEPKKEEPKKEEPATEKKKEEDPAKPAGKKDILGIKTKQPKAEEVKFEKIEDVLSTFGKSFGMELKDPSDINKIITQTNGWRQDAEKLKTVQKESEQFVQAYQSLPEEIHEAVKLFAEGKDFRDALKKSPIDFKVAPDKMSKKDLVNHYFPGKFTDEDFTAEEKGQALEIAEQAAMDKFNMDKQQFETKRATAYKQQEDDIKAFNASVEGSVKNLTQSFPDADKESVSLIKSSLEGGREAILSLFMENGVLKADAAEKLLFALNGRDIVSDYAEIAANQRETQLNEDLLKTATDRPAPVRGTAPSATATIDPETKAKIEELKRIAEYQKSQNNVFK